MVHVDPTETRCGCVEFVDETGTERSAPDAVIMTVIVSDPADALAGYNPSDPMSPDESTSREIARAILDALRTHTGS